MSHAHSHDHNSHGHSHTHDDYTHQHNNNNDQHQQQQYVTDNNILAEARHYCDIIYHYAHYASYHENVLNKYLDDYNKLSKTQQTLVPDFISNHQLCINSVYTNQKFIDMLIDNRFVFHNWNVDWYKLEQESYNNTSIDYEKMSKVRSTLKQCIRDWSDIGQYERNQCYKPIIDKVKQLFKLPHHNSNNNNTNNHNNGNTNTSDNTSNNNSSIYSNNNTTTDNSNTSVSSTTTQDHSIISPPRILVPGSGLCRLVWELANEGYNCEGNEFSYFMLLCSYYILNICNQQKSITLYPYITETKNWYMFSDRSTSIQIPDVNPRDVMYNNNNGSLSMCAGDFYEIYNDLENIKINDNSDQLQNTQLHHNLYDCVCTCYFIDCAPNILDYISTISYILKHNGYWINFGPLLYHYSDIHNDNEISIDLTWEQIVNALDKFGLKLIEQKYNNISYYTQPQNSMMETRYNCVFAVIQKVGNDTTRDDNQQAPMQYYRTKQQQQRSQANAEPDAQLQA